MAATLGGVAAVGAQESAAPAKPVAGVNGWIDVHAHFVPDGYRAATVAAGHGRPDGMPAMPA